MGQGVCLNNPVGIWELERNILKNFMSAPGWFWTGFLCAGVVLSGTGRLFAADPHYTVVELRFPNSPAPGTIQMGADGTAKPIMEVCNVDGLSENNRVTGTIVGGDGNEHPFVFDKGQVRDISLLPKAQNLGIPAISSEGIVLCAVTIGPVRQDHQNARLLEYDNDRVMEITARGNPATPFMNPNSRSEFLLASLQHETMVYSARTGQFKTFDGMVADAISDTGIIVGEDASTGNYIPAAIINGKVSRFPELAVDGYISGTGNEQVNSAGQFVTRRRGHLYLLDLLKHQAIEIKPPPNATEKVDPLKAFDLAFTQIDAQGDVISCYGQNQFIYRNGKSVFLADLIPDFGECNYFTSWGVMLGQFKGKRGHLFRYTLNTGILEDLGRPDTVSFGAQATNIKGQIGCAGDHAYLYSEGKFIDLQQFAPPDCDYVMVSPRFINENGMIVVYGVTKEEALPRGSSPIWRVLVLVPDSGNHGVKAGAGSVKVPATRP